MGEHTFEILKAATFESMGEHTFEATTTHL
jgi:hypothetical protein